MKHKCKRCGKEIRTTIVLACPCGTFCSKGCQTKYHLNIEQKND